MVCLAWVASLPAAIDAGDPGTPALVLGRGPGRELVPAVERWLHTRTDLVPRSPEQLGLEVSTLTACPADTLLSCLTRGTADLELRWLLLVSVRGDEAAVLVLELDVARAQLRAPGDELEDRLYADVVVVRVPHARADAALGPALDARLATRLAASGHLDVYGEIALATELPAPRLLELDGRALGATDALRITRVRPGLRRVTATAGAVVVSGEVRVSAGQLAELRLAPPLERPDNTWAWIGGGTSLALGVVALVGGLADGGGGAPQVCFRRAGSTCDDAAPLGPPAAPPDGAGRSPWLGLGVGLSALGAAWLVGTAVGEADGALWGLGVGVVAGGVSGGLLVAL